MVNTDTWIPTLILPFANLKSVGWLRGVACDAPNKNALFPSIDTLTVPSFLQHFPHIPVNSHGQTMAPCKVLSVYHQVLSA